MQITPAFIPSRSIYSSMTVGDDCGKIVEEREQIAKNPLCCVPTGVPVLITMILLLNS